MSFPALHALRFLKARPACSAGRAGRRKDISLSLLTVSETQWSGVGSIRERGKEIQGARRQDVLFSARKFAGLTREARTLAIKRHAVMERDTLCYFQLEAISMTACDKSRQCTKKKH